MRALKQDAKEKRYGRICLLLGIILLGTVGCSHTVSDTPSIDAEIAALLSTLFFIFFELFFIILYIVDYSLLYTLFVSITTKKRTATNRYSSQKIIFFRNY